jgi:hypothetical protein
MKRKARMPVSLSREIQEPCGCVLVWNDVEGQYHRHVRCSEHTVAKERARLRKAFQQSRDESKRREDAPLYSRPFSLFK